MEKMDRFQRNTIRSFRNVKKDILDLKEQLTRIAENQEKIMNILSEPSKNSKKKQETRYVERCRVKNFIASKEGEKFHIPECPFAKNIHPKSKVIFKSKTKALNAGYKPCECVKKS